MRPCWCAELILALGLVMVAVSSSFAQTSQLAGYIRDPSGRVVPGAQVTITNRDTGSAHETRSNDFGFYSVGSLVPGHYSVQVDAAGFGPAVSDVNIHVAENGGLDVTLDVSAVKSEVTVEGKPGNVSGRDGAVSTVIDRDFVSNLPMSGRTFQTLIALTPGVNITPSTSANPGQFSINGQRTSTNQFVIDGTSANFGVNNNFNNFQGFAGAQPALTTSGGTNGLVSVDALEQFRVQTSTYAPEFGRSPGGQVQIVTRSGTNRMSGALSEYFRNDALDAADWFTNAAGKPKDKSSQHDFGGVLGGPLKRDSLFFFLSYEGLRLQQPKTTVGMVPSLSLRAQASQSLRPIMDGFPLPNGPDLVNATTGLPTGMAQFTASAPDSVHFNATSLRMDYQASPGVSFFGRYNESPSTSKIRSGASNTLDALNQDVRMATGGANVVLSHRIFNELRLNYSQQDGVDQLQLDTLDGAVVPSTNVFFPDTLNPTTDRMSVRIWPPGGRVALSMGASAEDRQQQFQAIDSVTAMFGNHAFKAGVDYRLLHPTIGSAALSYLAYFQNIPDIQNGVVTLLLRHLQEPIKPTIQNVSLFGQDTWAVNARLNLTYGVRWDINPPASAAAGQAPLALQGLSDPATYALAPQGTPVYATSYTDVAPRVSLSYRLRDTPSWATVLRAGGGLFYDLGNVDSTRPFFSYPYFADISVNKVAYPLSGDSVTAPALSPTLTPPYGTLTAFPSGYKTPRTWQWNTAVEQDLPSSSRLTLTYVGAHGERLTRQDIRSKPNPSFSSVYLIHSDATSDYDALQAQVERRLANGFQAYAAYTWSHAIDEVSDTLSYALLRGNADFDRRHVLNVALTYVVPHLQSRPMDAIASGWTVSGLARWQSALPVEVTSTSLVNLLGITQEVRPNLTPGVPIYVTDPRLPGGQGLNAAVDPSRPGCVGAFCVPTTGTQGNLGRNVVRGFPASQIDLSIRRSIGLAMHSKVSVAVEAFNVFNHPNFGPPVGDITSGQFGRPSSTLSSSLGGLSPLYQIGGPRSMQLSARFEF